MGLLGRRDSPTDAVEDYCERLGCEFERQGWVLDLVRVPWDEVGWSAAIESLEERAAQWRGCWVLVQYTALGWSRRGFSLGFLRVLRTLHRLGARSVVVFHDALPYSGSRLIDRFRRACQVWVMRTAYQCADRSVLPVPLDHVTWLPSRSTKAVFIQIGANLPPITVNGENPRTSHNSKTVAVFGVTGEPATLSEVRDIGHVLRRARAEVENLRLVVFGRGSAEAEPALRQELEGSGIETQVLGLLPPEDLARELTEADVLLFVRGGVSSRRGSALAGIACGLPVVGYFSEETGFPITEAGVVLVSLRDRVSLGEALVRVLAEDNWRQQLRARSRAAQEQYFSWEVIAGLFFDLLERSVKS
jgi:glycosyltransferase involved in cell wall biosynthesis